jgi:hypothetical protein
VLWKSQTGGQPYLKQGQASVHTRRSLPKALSRRPHSFIQDIAKSFKNISHCGRNNHVNSQNLCYQYWLCWKPGPDIKLRNPGKVAHLQYDLEAAFAKSTDSSLGPVGVQQFTNSRKKYWYLCLHFVSVSFTTLNFGSDTCSTLHICKLII